MLKKLAQDLQETNHLRLFLLSITGRDRPGVTAALSAVLAQHKARILDMGQAVIHDALSLGILCEFPEEANTRAALKDVVFRAHELSIAVDISPIEAENYSQWVSNEDKPRYVVTLLARVLEADQLAAVAEVTARHGLNIDAITRLSSRPPFSMLERQRSCIELSLRGQPQSLQAYRLELMQLGQSLECDIAFQTQGIFRRNRRLVCFDMDSTLIQAEVIDELAQEAGVKPQVAELTTRAMRGELDFSQSFRQRLALLEGLEEAALERVAERLIITEGAERLIHVLKIFGYKTAIISGGFSYFANFLSKKLNFDYIYSHDLEIKNGQLTGKHLGEIIDGNAKARILQEIARQEGISLDQVIAIGDGSNDIPMLNLAGLGIAFHAKPLVQEKTQHSISTLGLDATLYLLGLRDREIAAV